MDKFLNRFFTVITTIIFFIIFNLPVFADTNVQYTALGDSIAAGYALQNSADGYAGLLSFELGLDVQNLGMPGLTSVQLLNDLQTLSNDKLEKLSASKLITVSIGSNDVLSAFTNMSFENSPEFTEIMENGELDDPSKLFDMISSVLDNDLEKMLVPYVGVFENNLPLIIEKLKEINPDAQIVFTNFYNPYKSIQIPQSGMDMGEITDTLMVMMNDVLYLNSGEDYKVADVYTPFEIAYSEGKSPVNVSVLNTTFNVDPHPNEYGHMLIKDAILDVLSINALNSVNNDETIQETINEDVTEEIPAEITAFEIFSSDTQSDEQKIVNINQKTFSPETGIDSVSSLGAGALIVLAAAIMFKNKK